MTTTNEDGEKRPATPYDYHRLDSLRSTDGIPTVSLPTPPADRHHHHHHQTQDQYDDNNNNDDEASRSAIPSLELIKAAGPRPSTPPNRAAVPTFQFTGDDLKRDSAIHNSHDNCSSATQSPFANGAISPSPTLPSIVIQDAAPPKSSRSNRSFLRKFSSQTEDRPSHDDEESTLQGHQRLRSFHGIEMDIPSTSGLEDLNQPEKLKFTNRGSVLLNGKKLDHVITGQTDGANASREDGVPTPPQTPPTPMKGQGLQTGRRTPSVHMLQAVMQGSRVLSAEEVTFSERVRTMYNYGDEKAADWTTGGALPSPNLDPSSHLPRDDTPEPTASALNIDNPRKRPPPASPHSGSRNSFIARTPGETAGGIEDWDEIPEGGVDRYGFIKPSRILSNDTSGGRSLAPPDRPGMQRVSTSLQMLSNSPRQPRRGLFRGPSAMKRYSRSLPPSRSASRQTLQSVGGAASIYSYQSNQSSTRIHNPFRSRDRRVLDEASDMLTLPSYLSPLAEATEVPSNPHQEQLRLRERAREAKWHKMARPIASSVRGGGMKFNFDTSDPKLVARTWKGIPDRWRATAWHSFLTTSAKKRGNYPSDETLNRMFVEYQEQSSADDVQIDVDVPRTISMHIMFRRRYRGGQRLLFRVLHAISLHFPTTGYVQGMAALAATLLCYYDEETAFVMLVRMWQLRGLEELYKAGFAGLMAALDEFSNQWLTNDSEASEKLLDLGIDPTAYGTRWYLTLFNMSIPFAAQLRVWDVFMLLGDASTTPGGSPSGKFAGADLSVLHATSCAIVEAMRTVLLDSDFENGMKMLTSWVPVQDEDLLMRVARAEWKIGIRNRRRDGRIMS